MKIINEQDFPLLNRKTLTIELEHVKEKTPSEKEIKPKLAEFLKTQENLIAIKHIYTNFGYGISKVIVNKYDDEQNFNKYEVIHKKIKHGKEENKKQEAKPKT